MSLAALSMSGGSVLELFVNGNSNASYIYTTNLTVSSGNYIKVGGLANVTYSGGVAQYPLITYQTGTPTVPGVIMPSGFIGSGSIIPNGTEWDLYVSTNPPNTNLVWRAPGGTADWDTSSKYWFDPRTGVMTNFHNGDWVTFDDTPGYATNINQAVPILLPGQVTMTNTVLAYKFTGFGVQGGGTLTKTGTGTLQIAGTLAIPMTITQGLLTDTSAGTIVGVSIAAGASLASAGTVNGNVSCSGQVYNLGTINGALSVSSGGVVTNLFTIQGGAFTLDTNTFLYNGLEAIMDNFGSSTIATNATLINDGYLGTSLGGYLQTIAVSGTLKDTGLSGTADSLATMSLQTLTINPGGLFIPGGDGIGTSRIRTPAGAGSGNPGRVILSSGSTNIFKVDPGTLSSTLLRSGYQDFGPSQAGQQQNGCTIIITNVTGASFQAGQYFKMFNKYNDVNPVPTGTATNSFPIIVPATPGPGLIWDLRYLWGDIGAGNWGYIGVATPPVVYFTNSISVMDVTNIVGQFSWASTNFGWRLETLVTPTTVGLVTSSNYNWAGVPGSWTNTSWTLTNNTRPGTNVFYRLVFP